MSQNERSLHGSLAAHVSWGNTDDRTARTAPARAAFMDQFDAMVPPEVTDPAERMRRAEHFKIAYFKRLALKSAQSRRKKAS